MRTTLAVLVCVLFACSVCYGSVFSRAQARLSAADAHQRSGAQTCDVTTCAGAGGSCNASSVRCVGNTYCDSTYKTCTSYVAVGALCNTSAQCEYRCGNGVCLSNNAYSVGAGGHCTNDTDCEPIGANLPGPFGSCVSGRCYGLFIGERCNNTDQNEESGCINSYCNHKTLLCTPWGVSGANCSDIDRCNELLMCGNGTCNFMVTAAKGANCTLSDMCDSGLYCGTDKICHDSSDITRSSCNDTSPCSNGLYCECSGVTGKNVCFADTSSGIISSYTAYQKCWEANNCSLQTYGTECSEGVCAPYTCGILRAFYSGSLELAPQCLVDDYNQHNNVALAKYNCIAPDDSNFPTWAIVLIVIGGILVLAALGYFVYVKTSKKDQYSSI